MRYKLLAHQPLLDRQLYNLMFGSLLYYHKWLLQLLDLRQACVVLFQKQLNQLEISFVLLLHLMKKIEKSTEYLLHYNFQMMATAGSNPIEVTMLL